MNRSLFHPLKLIVSSIFACFLFTFAIPFNTSSAAPSSIADWARLARVGGFDVDPEMTDQEVSNLMTVRQQENVSILEVDSGLSFYMDSAKFQIQTDFLTRVATMAHASNMRAVVYYPSLEVTTPNGETIPNTMFKDHPDWIQKGIDGTPNVFYGSQEVWVEPGMESAWMSPNTGYRDYFLNRVRQLAATQLDGIWVDVPIYLGTGAPWAGAEPAAAAAFNAWSIAQGIGGVNGYQIPTVANWDDPAFRAWIRWRHENLADFIEAIRAAAHEVNPNFMVVIENFPADYMDGTETGLDGTYRVNNQKLLRVWEIDSVSNTKAMEWASVDEFSNKLTMYKWARAVDRENPSWAFTYGSKPLDAGLTVAAAVTSGVVPFESQTPEMTLTVDSAFRSRWFGFILDHQQALLGTPRSANVGVWYSSPTRDYQDFKAGGGYGMYVTTANPNNDPNWWSTEPGDSALPKPHLGGYRGAAHALTKLHIPYKVIADPGSPATELTNTKLLWLPSVAAISNAAADAIKNFVSSGGVVLATGELPGTLDEKGDSRGGSIFQDLFDFSGPGESVNFYGSGVAVYNPSVRGADMFASVSDPKKANEDLGTVEQLVRIHVPDDLIVDAPDGIHVEIGKASDIQHYLYVINYSGLKKPIVSSPQNITIDYRAPDGYRIANASVVTPDVGGQSGTLAVQQSAKQYYQMTVNVDQFAMISLTLAPESPPAPTPGPTPVWPTPERQEAAQSGLNFILSSMRHSNAAEPMKFGIYTNLLNDSGLTEIYAHGHHVSAEHMGLMLRASSCMGDTVAYQQSYRFVDELMVDPLYHIVNWAIDRDRHKPLVELDGFWKNSNAPLDDFRVIRGLLAGPSMNMPNGEKLGETLLSGLYWTSVTDREHTTPLLFPTYPDGIVGYAWDWSGTTEAALSPPAKATGIGGLTTDPVPTDYNDLYMLGQAVKVHPRWKPLLESSTDLLLNAEVPGVPGLFYNGYEANGNWTGDFENRDINQGQHLKVIQMLWIALHLAGASEFEPDILDASRRSLARDAAARSLAFFKNYYTANSRIPEYLTFNGGEVPVCTGTNIPNGCLIPQTENLLNGEARIYALLARLALLLDDSPFASTLIEEQILTDRISDPNDPRYGLIGVSTAAAGDAEAWNVLESVLTLCLEATQGNSSSGQAPVASNQSVTLTQDQSASIALQASDPNQDPLTYQIVSQPGSGSLSGTAPNLVYTPNPGYSGADSFTFKANDGTFDSNTAVVNLTINPTVPINTPPVANAQNVTTHENTSITILLTATDQEGDPLTFAVVTNPLQGTLSGTAPNLTYTPNPGYTGTDQFTFRANDGFLDSEIVAVDITIQTSSGNGSISNPVTSIATDGDLSDWNGLQSFGTDADDVSGANNMLDWLEGWTAHDTDHVYIAYRNDGAIDQENWWSWQIYIDTDQNPITGYWLSDAFGAEIHIEENMVRSYTGNGDSWAWQDVGVASSGVLNNVAELRIPKAWLGNVNTFGLAFYGENAAFPGGTAEDNYPDGIFNEQANVRFFRYSLQATSPSGQPPVASDRAITLTQDGLVPITLQASDPDQDPLTYQIISQPSSGSLSGTAPNLTYTPNPGYSGADSFTFKANDGTFDSNTAVVSLTINPTVPTNTAPVANAQSVTTSQNTAVTVILTATDQENDPLTFQVVTNPTQGTLSGSAPNLTYTPNPGYSGADSFTFKANDGTFDSNTAVVSLTINPTVPTNTAPVANAQSVTTSQDTAVTVILTATDQENDPLTFQVVTNPTQGTLSGSASNLTYTPNPGYSGTDSFTFKANDGLLDSNVVTVNITIQTSGGNGEVSNPVTSITTDGDLSDWAGLQSFGADPDDVSGSNNKLDWREGWMAHDVNNVYLAYRNDGAIDQDNWWGWQIYIDSDNNPNTGYRLNNEMGAEIHIEENMVRSYTGNGDSWAWQDLGIAGSGVRDDVVELSIPKVWFGNADNFWLVFYGENAAFPGGTTEDYYPDGASNEQAPIRFFRYGF